MIEALFQRHYVVSRLTLYARPLRLSGKMLNMIKVSRYAGYLRGLVIKVWIRKCPRGGSICALLSFRTRKQEIVEVGEENEEARWGEAGRWRWEISKLKEGAWRRSVAHVRLRLARPTWPFCPYMIHRCFIRNKWPDRMHG